MVSDPAYFRRKNTRIVFIQFESLWITESVMYAFTLESRKIGTFLKEVDMRPVQVFQGLPQNLGMSLAKKSSSLLFFPCAENSA
jgi:hypothetical protein